MKTASRCTHVIAFLAYVVFPESALQDIVNACKYFPSPFYTDLGDGHHKWHMVFSCILRFTQGFLGILSAWVLIVTSETVVDVILNFAAMSFVSSLDESAFELAQNGVFGPLLRNEANGIAEGKSDTVMDTATEAGPNETKSHYKLKNCFKREIPEHRWYWGVMVFAASVFVVLSSLVYASQDNDLKWSTTKLRVQFTEDEFKEYSGCYEVDHKTVNRRFSYKNNNGNTSISYCLDQRRWMLLEQNDDPCNGTEMGFSAKTDSFDILSSFEESWLTLSGAPLELYTFSNPNDEENGVDSLHCSMTLGDGKCDDEFNKPGFQYDEGDCCAATCVGTQCGRNGINEVFGIEMYATGFRCRNPTMKPITIYLNTLKTSRSEEFGKPDDFESFEFETNVTEWRAEPPGKPYFAVNCNGKNVFTTYIEKAMEWKSESIMVEDGAHCEIHVRKNEEPIWIVDYTIFHGADNRSQAILSHSSNRNETATFTRIPDCFIEELEGLYDANDMYNKSSSEASTRALDWLVSDEQNIEYCGSRDLVERFVLLTLYYSAGAPDSFLNRGHHCTWPLVTCSGGRVLKLLFDPTELTGKY